MQSFLGGTGLIIPEGGGGGGGDGGGDPVGGTSGEEKSITKKKNLIKGYLKWAKGNYEDFAGKVAKIWEGIAQVVGAVLNGISNLFAAQANKENTILSNQETRQNEKVQKAFEREEAIIANSTLSQEQKDSLLIKLKEKYDKKQDDLDKKMDSKRKALQKKQAIRDKQLAIASAIMNTASAVVNALTAGPIAGPILAGIVAGLGAGQIAAIASTPIPLAKGGLAFGPVNSIVGDNPNAKNDPEVIAPLSKLKSMLGGEMNVSLNVGGVLKGNDIFLANDNISEIRERYI